MKILITGANGYIGKSLYYALKDTHQVSIITRDECDLTNSKEVNFYFLNNWFDVVIHCAVKGGSRLNTETSEIIDANLTMYYNILQNKQYFRKLIHFGSGAEFSQSEMPYGLSKKVISKSINGQKDFYNLRIYAVFDELELDRRFIKSNIKRYINKQPIEIHDNKYMDFFYMKDLIKLVEHYIENENLPKQVDCTYSESLTLKDIADFINTLDNHKVEIKIKGSESLIEGYIGFNKNLKLDYVGLKQGIINTYNKLKWNQ